LSPVNRLMKNILARLFAIITCNLTVNFAGFRKFLAEYSSLHPVLALPLVEVGGCPGR